jgi:hypothetical protein
MSSLGTVPFFVGVQALACALSAFVRGSGFSWAVEDDRLKVELPTHAKTS